MKQLIKSYVTEGYGVGVHASANLAWFDNLRKVNRHGSVIAPRGQATVEVIGHSVGFEMQRPVVVNKARKLNYRFMAAEAHWILSGDDSVEAIAKYNKHIAKFSDDGVKFFGAYGPRVVDQLDFVVTKLNADESSRQATLTTWRQNPPETKDVPCTVAMHFMIRDGRLMTNVFMRSNDVWLGTPYDMFSFSMISFMVCARLNERRSSLNTIEPGALVLHVASSHLYEVNFEAARQVLIHGDGHHQQTVPVAMWQSQSDLMQILEEIKDSSPGDTCRWWEQEAE